MPGGAPGVAFPGPQTGAFVQQIPGFSGVQPTIVLAMPAMPASTMPYTIQGQPVPTASPPQQQPAASSNKVQSVFLKSIIPLKNC